MRTSEFLAALRDRLPADCIFVSALGRTSEELFHLAAERTLFTDTMGDVAALSAGMALGAPSVPIAGIDTDGSFLMNLSVLPTLGRVLPGLENHVLIIVDNGIYESAGGLPSGSENLDWESLFEAVGINAVVVREVAGMPKDVLGRAQVLIAKVVNDEPALDSVKTIDGIESSYRIERLIAKLAGRAERKPAIKS
ncbi:thiamine pyrophosphate-dependent enzyme [Nonomuraea sp. NPDC050153]|uniref:thiamine pyrophosphate-dependent enzyme n=1 Tax=Nonomuraea sp. NPDC050153 TaxID=3364359 RepID=UPI0037A57D0F